MLDIGFSEIVVIALVALVVIGPRDLPVVMHRLGRFVRDTQAQVQNWWITLDHMGEERLRAQREASDAKKTDETP